MSRLIDLKGQLFGCWEVLYRLPNEFSPLGKPRVAWQCRCIGCNRLFKVRTLNIRQSGSAGCRNCRATNKNEDRWAEAYELSEKGLSFSEVGAIMGISRGHAWKLAQQYLKLKASHADRKGSKAQ